MSLLHTHSTMIVITHPNKEIECYVNRVLSSLTTILEDLDIWQEQYNHCYGMDTMNLMQSKTNLLNTFIREMDYAYLRDIDSKIKEKVLNLIREHFCKKFQLEEKIEK